jgi:hypothetical protein
VFDFLVGVLGGGLFFFLLDKELWVYAILVLLSLLLILTISVFWNKIVFHLNKTRAGKALLIKFAPQAKVSAEVKENLNRAIKHKRKAFLGYRLPSVELTWVEGLDKLTRRSDEMVIYLAPELDNDEGLFWAIEEYVDKVFMSDVKAVCSPEVANIIKLVLIESLAGQLFSSRRVMMSLYAATRQELIPPGDHNLEDYLETLRIIKVGGFFEPIFIFLIRWIASDVAFGRLHPDITGDILLKFAEFLKEIALKGHREPVPLDFPQIPLEVSIILITHPEKAGLHAHLKVLKKLAEGGYNLIFVSGMGEKVELVKYFVERRLSDPKVRRDFPQFFRWGPSYTKTFKEGKEYETITYLIEFRGGQAR